MSKTILRLAGRICRSLRPVFIIMMIEVFTHRTTHSETRCHLHFYAKFYLFSHKLQEVAITQIVQWVINKQLELVLHIAVVSRSTTDPLRENALYLSQWIVPFCKTTCCLKIKRRDLHADQWSNRARIIGASMPHHTIPWTKFDRTTRHCLLRRYTN